MNEERQPEPQPEEPITLKVEEKEMVPPASAAGEKWTMPEPVFRQTSGYLPQGFEKRFPGTSTEEATPAGDAPESQVPEASDIRPQPDISEEFARPPIAADSVEVKRPAVRVTFIVLAVIVMLAFAAIFLTAIYLLFFYQAEGAL